jgi:cytoskeleton protein RodZ
MMSTVRPLITDAPSATRAGADLREARERLGLSLYDLAYNLRIRAVHLEALEEGRIDVLPGSAYALAFVRNYASALGLDPEEMVRRFKTETAEFSRQPELIFPVPVPERGLPTGAVMFLGLVLVIGAYIGWYRLSGEGRLPAETVATVPERLAPLAQQAIPSPNDAAARIANGAASVPSIPAIVAVPQASAISPASAVAAPLPVTATIDPAPVAAAPALPDGTRIVLRATADAWLLVKDRTGAIILNRTMKPGETWPVPPRGDLALTTGNAGGTEIVVDGTAIPSLGAPGAVRRELPLDPARLKDGTAVLAIAPAVVPQASPTPPRQ